MNEWPILTFVLFWVCVYAAGITATLAILCELMWYCWHRRDGLPYDGFLFADLLRSFRNRGHK